MKNVLNAIYLFIFLVLEGGQGCSFVVGLLGDILLVPVAASVQNAYLS